MAKTEPTTREVRAMYLRLARSGSMGAQICADVDRLIAQTIADLRVENAVLREALRKLHDWADHNHTKDGARHVWNVTGAVLAALEAHDD